MTNIKKTDKGGIELIDLPSDKGIVTMTIPPNVRDVYKIPYGVTIHGKNGTTYKIDYRTSQIDGAPIDNSDALYKWFQENLIIGGEVGGSTDNGTGEEGKTPSLLAITNVGNVTNNEIIITGHDKHSDLDGLHFNYDIPTRKGSINAFNDGKTVSSGQFAEGSINLTVNKTDGTVNPSKFTITDEPNKEFTFNKPVIAGNAVNDNQLLTLGQAKSLGNLDLQKVIGYGSYYNGNKILTYRTTSDIINTSELKLHPLSIRTEITKGGGSMNSIELTSNKISLINKQSVGSKINGIEIWNVNEIPSVSDKSIVVTDQSKLTGIHYGADYSANQTNDNVIPSLKTVKNLITNKVDKVAGKDLSKNDFTDAYKQKLDAVGDTHFRGRFESLDQLQGVIIGKSGDYAYVKVVTTENPNGTLESFIWDVALQEWKIAVDMIANETPSSVKEKYESNANTNAYTDAEKTKLAGLSNYNDTAIKNTLNNKVDKVAGKDLSTNDYSIVDKNKLDSLYQTFLGVYEDTLVLENVVGVEGAYALVEDGNGSYFTFYWNDVDKLWVEPVNVAKMELRGVESDILTFDKNNYPISKRLGWEEIGGVEPTQIKEVVGFVLDDGVYRLGNLAVGIDSNGNSVATPNTIPTYGANGELSVETSALPKSAVNTEKLTLELDKKVDKVDGKGLSKNDFTDADKTKLDELVNYDPTPIMSWVGMKQDKEYGKGLSTNDFTDVLRAKLEGLEEGHFKGRFETIEDLELVVGKSGDYAYVVVVTTEHPDGVLENYIWDAKLSKWKPSVDTSGTSETPVTVKQKYESNADTNVYNDADKAKLGGVESFATKNRPDADLLNRANHTGKQEISTIEGLQPYLDQIKELPEPRTNERGVVTVAPKEEGGKWYVAYMSDDINPDFYMDNDIATVDAVVKYVRKLAIPMRQVVEGDCSSIGSSVTLRMGKINEIELKYEYLNSTALKATIRSIYNDVKVDYKRLSNYDAGLETTYKDDYTMSFNETLEWDYVLLSQSREVNNSYIRINGALYVVKSFVSARGARVTIWTERIV